MVYTTTTKETLKKSIFRPSFPQSVGGNLTEYDERCPTTTFGHDAEKVKKPLFLCFPNF